VQLRASQLKFHSPDLSFNVIRPATFSPGFLNRQTIQLLQCAGVPQSYFLQKQDLQLKEASVSDLVEQVETQG
jgi:hypothetical protein